MKGLSVYLSHPLSGLTAEEVDKWYTAKTEELKYLGFNVYDPVTMQKKIKELKSMRLGHVVPDGHGPVTNNHSIYERDKWAVSQADIILVDLTGAINVSIGCVMEIGWAALQNKHVVVVMEQHNPHRHTFVLESADVVFETIEESLEYLVSLNA